MVTLLKNKTAELAHGLDDQLISLLLNNSATKDRFFKDIGDVTVFDKDAFVEFIYNKNFLEDSYTILK